MPYVSSESKFLSKLLGWPITILAADEALRTRDELSQAARFAKAFGHQPRVLVQMALQDSVRESGLKLKVSVEDEAA